MALEHDLIGVSMTNAAPLVVPTFGRTAVLGTNPISLTAPASKEKPFVLDMATSVVPRGKLEVYDRLKKKMPLGWAVDATGKGTSDPHTVLEAGSEWTSTRQNPMLAISSWLWIQLLFVHWKISRETWTGYLKS